MKKDDLTGQLSIFDMELSPNSPGEKTDAPEKAPGIQINGAKVPDEEFNSYTKVQVPTVNEILKMLEKGLYKVNSHEFLSDIFECGAIAVSNRFDRTQAKEREERYVNIMKKYNPDMRQLIVDIFTKIFQLLLQQTNPHVRFADYLGELYMRSETSNSKAGQFFTPYNLSKMCAQVAINDSLVTEYMEQDQIITLNEPACGSGGMILAAADHLYNNYHFNIARNLFVVCSDIDSRCVHMSYLQLGLAGIPAVIYRQDTLTLQTWDKWETPAYIMNYMRFRDCLGDCYASEIEWRKRNEQRNKGA